MITNEDIARAWERRFEADLSRILLRDSEQETEEEWIEARAAELRLAHGPITAANIGEAIDSEEGQEVATLFNRAPISPLDMIAFAQATIKVVEGYWTAHFTEAARQEYYSECRF